MRPARRDGFLLIELIVAVSILSIGLVLILRALLAASGASGIIADKIAALELLETRMAEVEELAEKGGLEDGDDSIDAMVGVRAAKLELRVVTLAPGGNTLTKSVGVRASWRSAGKYIDEYLETYVDNKAPDA